MIIDLESSPKLILCLTFGDLYLVVDQPHLLKNIQISVKKVALKDPACRVENRRQGLYQVALSERQFIPQHCIQFSGSLNE